MGRARNVPSVGPSPTLTRQALRCGARTARNQRNDGTGNLDWSIATTVEDDCAHAQPRVRSALPVVQRVRTMTEMTPELICFSVFIPVWNGGRWLPRAISSLLEQTYPHWELVIGD